VLVEATIAEVTLNDALQYGTQWFFRQGKGSVSLINNSVGQPVQAVLPGFNFAITGSAVQTALSALESVTTVKVISDPQLLVLDNEYARLQVGDLVPIVTQSAVSVTTSGAPIVNNVDYRETGVILEVAPRVNSGNLVTLDIQQEVSDVVPTTTSTIDSPTIEQRKVRTRVVVQDGETIALGGLIKDTSSVGNSGLPWLTDVPVLGALFGTRSHSVARTELLVLLTPHVIHDQRDVRALTDELRQRLGGLAAEPVPHDPLEPPGPLRTPKTP
jgi:general secretion pathway protein D